MFWNISFFSLSSEEKFLQSPQRTVHVCCAESHFWFVLSGHLRHCAAYLNNSSSSRAKALQPTLVVCTGQFIYRDMGREADQNEFFYDVHDTDVGFEDFDDGHQHKLDLN